MKDQLATSLADGKLTSDELLKNAAGLQLLQGTLGTSVNGQSAVIQEMQKVTNALIQSQNQLVAEAQRQAGLIKTLRGPSS